MRKLIENYHSHTYRCGHASNYKDEEYVISAIDNNFKVIGFSDHAPFPNIYHPFMRMNMNDFESYLKSIEKLQNKYKDKIKIYKGLEIEYIEDYEYFYKECFDKYKLDYLILGQHLKYSKDFKPIFYFDSNKNNKNGIIQYRDDLIKGIKSHYFSYVCHPDLFLINIDKFDAFAKEISISICRAAKKENIPLEINLNGFINHREYPSIDFFKIAKSFGNKFIFGIDAHNPIQYKNIPYNELEKFLNESNIDDNDILDSIKFYSK